MDLSQNIVDLNFLLSRAKHGLHQIIHIRKTLPQIRKILEQKNQRYHYPSNVWSRASRQIDERGVNSNQVNALEKDYQQRLQIMAQSQMQYSIFKKTLSIQTINDYIDSKIDKSCVNNLEILLLNTKINKRFKDKVLKRKNCSIEFDSSLQPLDRGIKIANTQIKMAYHEVIKKLLLSKNMTSQELLQLLYKVCENPIWKFLYLQLKGWSGAALKEQICANTVKIIQNKFAQDLPLNNQITQYFYNHIDDKKSQVFLAQDGLPVWGVCYLLLRAGKHQQIIKLLMLQNSKPCRSLARDLTKYIDNKQLPHYQFKWPYNNCCDIYISQIYNIFNRIPNIMPSLLNHNPFNFIWFALKTCTLSSTDTNSQFTLSELQSHIKKQHNQNKNIEESTEKLFYTLNYDYLLTIRNKLIDVDQRIHLDIVFQVAGFERNGMISRERSGRYEKHILEYAGKMLVYGLGVSLNYVALIEGLTEFTEALSTLLIQNERVEEFFGIGNASYMNPLERFGDVLNKRCSPDELKEVFIYIAIQYSYKNINKRIVTAKIILNIVKNITLAVNHLVAIQLQSLVHSGIPPTDVQEAIRLINNIKSKPETCVSFTPEYNNILSFINEYRKLQKAYLMEKYDQIKNIRKTSVYFPAKLHYAITHELQSLITELAKISYLRIYYSFIRLIYTSNQIIRRKQDISKVDHQIQKNTIIENCRRVFKIILELPLSRIKESARTDAQQLYQQLQQRCFNWSYTQI